jgi:hypothetical protein
LCVCVPRTLLLPRAGFGFFFCARDARSSCPADTPLQIDGARQSPLLLFLPRQRARRRDASSAAFNNGGLREFRSRHRLGLLHCLPDWRQRLRHSHRQTSACACSAA